MISRTTTLPKILFAATAFATGICFQSKADPAQDGWETRLENPDFQTGTAGWTRYPKDTPLSAFTPDDKRLYNERSTLLLSSDPDAKDFSIYQTIPVEGGRLYEIKVIYGGETPDSLQEGDLVLKLAFIRKGGRNGSAGIERWVPPAQQSREWKEASRFVYVPSEAENCQFSLSLVKGGKKVWLAGATLRAEESYTIPRIGEPLSTTIPEAWDALPSLEGFWQVDTSLPAKQGTEVKVAYDDKHLYLRIRNDEPYLSELRQNAVNRDDKATYFDDCNELFIAVSEGVVRQFITTAGGIQWDGALFQKAAGDPFRADAAWNGTWKSHVVKGTNEWTSYWAIPWSDLGVSPASGLTLKLNIGRQRHTGIAEISQWNHFNGGFNTVDKFAHLTFGEQSAELIRTVEPIANDLLKVSRKNFQYDELLSNEAGEYRAGDWAYAYYLASYPNSYQAQFTPKQWKEKQSSILEEMGQHGMFGPAIPWVSQVGWDTLVQAHERWGMKFPVFMGTSSINRTARESGARFVCPRSGTVSDIDPAKIKAMEHFVRDYFARNPVAKPLVLTMNGTDEPTNTMFSIFSRTLRPSDTAILDEVENDIRQLNGSQYGLYDYFAPATASAPDAPFQRIAFNRWWNHRMGEAAEKIRKFVKEIAPEAPFQAFQHNTVSGMTQGDIPILSQWADWVSVDPYPTATLRIYGQARALYHTGFSTKFVHDLSGGKATQTILQGFEYHGRAPRPEEVREWASQALKNGASIVNWYTSGPSRYKLPEMYAEVLAINKQVHEMKRLKLPDASQTVIFCSMASQAGLDDPVLHSTYTAYALLGEKIGSWFRFVSESSLVDRPQPLEKASLIYLPQAAYLSRPTAETLLHRVRSGATLVVLDPQAFMIADDGSDLSDLRLALIGSLRGKRIEAASIVTEAVFKGIRQGWSLPLTPATNIGNLSGIQAFATEVPSGAALFAHYSDGSPAAFLRPVGKGRVLYFAAQPFGDSSLAISESRWPDLFRALAEEAGAPTDLPIWDFYLQSNH